MQCYSKSEEIQLSGLDAIIIFARNGTYVQVVYFYIFNMIRFLMFLSAVFIMPMFVLVFDI